MEQHLDCSQDKGKCRLTTVFSINGEWSEADAGEIVVYEIDDRPLVALYLKAGQRLVFFSEPFPHEVRSTHTERISAAGWLCVNGDE